MKTIATCAACGNKKELCGSCKMGGVQQPRICKDCLIAQMGGMGGEIRDELWILQLVELNDTDSLAALREQTAKEAR